MPYKIAVASTDGISVNTHFGRAEDFFIYTTDENGSSSFLEERLTPPACSGNGHSDSAVQRSVSLISDCRFVLVSRVGPGAESALAAAGVTPLCIAAPFDEALKKAFEYVKFTETQK